MKDQILSKLTPRVKIRLRNLVSLYITLENQEKNGVSLSETKKHIVNSFVKINEEDPIVDLWPFNTITMKNVWVNDSTEANMDLFSSTDVKEFFKLYRDFLTAIADFGKKENNYFNLEIHLRSRRFKWMDDLESNISTDDLDEAANQNREAKFKVLSLELALFNLWVKHI